MPSAANVKLDKQVSPENVLLGDPAGSTPIRQAITTIEHKIRNLEKRKAKLESYRELQNAGKELNADQKTAVAKYNEVAQTLEFARDLCKQFLNTAVASEKEAKKLLKKEAAAKNQAELARLREILLVQDALNQMGNENVREDFLHGRNGAAQLTESDIKLLDDLYPAVTPKHETGNPTAFTNEVQTAAEHLLAVVDGKAKEVFGGSYSQIKEILGKIHESGYFDQVQVFEGFVESGEAVVSTQDAQMAGNVGAETSTQENLATEQNIGNSSGPLPIETLPIDVRPNASTNVPVHSNVVEAPVQPPPSQGPPLELPQVALPQQQINAEQVFYQQMPVVDPSPVQQPPQILRPPITELLSTANFHFLQDSEIDPAPADQQPQPPPSIPSQTFTNQSFVTGGGPPQPIPLPTHFLHLANNVVTAPNLPNPIDDSVVASGPTIPLQQTLVSKQQPTDDLHQNVVPANVVGVNQVQPPVHHHHQQSSRGPHQHQRIQNASANSNNNPHQSYYQNNNGYSNNNNHRPRQHQPQSHHQQQRNGPRPGGGNNNRH